MMEKFQSDHAEWERRHRRTWLGRYGGDIGTGVSAQIDLLSPFSVVDFVQRPTAHNAAKVMYTPALGSMAYSLVGWMTGTKIGFTQRVIHSVDMTVRTGKGLMHTWGHQAKAGLRALPGVAAAALLAAAGYYGSQIYGDFSGSAGIGDIRMPIR